MANFNFDQADVVELNTQESNEIDAGGVWGMVCKAVGYVLIAGSAYAESQGW